MSLLSELVTVKCWKYRSRNRGGLLHSDTNGQLWRSLHLNGAFLFISSIAQLRFTNVQDRRQLADTKNGRAKVPPPWSVYSERDRLWKVTSGSFWHWTMYLLCILFLLPSVWCIPWYIPCPSPGLCCFLYSRSEEEDPTDYPVLIKSGWSSVSFDTSQPLSSPQIFLLWCSLGIAVLCMLRNGSRLGFRCSGLPLGSIPHWLISVSVQNDSCCCLWSSLGIFCLCSGCSKSTFGSSLALLLDFLLVAILFRAFSSLCWNSFSLFMHVVCLFP